MPWNIPGIPFKLTAEDMGVPDYIGAMQKGFNLGASPKILAENLLAQKLSNAINSTKAKYAEQEAMQGLEAQKAQTALSQGQLGMMPLERRMKEAQLGLVPWNQRLLQSQAAQAQANAQKAQQMGNLYNFAMRGGFQQGGMPQNQGQQMPSYQEGHGMPPYAQQMQGGQQAPQTQTGQYNPQADMAAALMKMPVYHQTADGQLISVNPLSGLTSTKIGPSEREKAFTKEDVKIATNYQNAAIAGRDIQDTYNEVGNIIASPEFEQMRQHAILGKHELGWYSKFGTKEQQDMVGQFNTLTGDIIRKSAREFKGSFRVGEQGLLNSMKPNSSDTVDVAKGKIKSLSLMNQLLTQRSSLTSDLIRQGYSPNQASKLADQQIDGNKIREEIKNQLNPKKTINLKAFTEQDIIDTAQKHGISVEEVKNQLKAKGLYNG